MRYLRIIYRNFWDFPHNWAVHGWVPEEMTAFYWRGFSAHRESQNELYTDEITNENLNE